MARPRGKNRERLLESGLELLSHRGYAATGVQEIADASGVPKGSFYNYFDSKEEFAIEVLRRYQELTCRALHEILGDGSKPPLARLGVLFARLSADFAGADFAGGCLAARLSQELAGETPVFREPLAWVFDCMQGAIAGVLREARERGDLAPGDDPDALAEFLLNAWQGAAMRAKAAGCRRPLDVFTRVALGRLLGAAPAPA